MYGNCTRKSREYGLSVSVDAQRHAERFAHYYFSGTTYLADLERLGADGVRHVYFQRVLQAMQCAGDLDGAARAIMRRLHETPRQRFVPDAARNTLTQLRADGYTLGLITNRRADEMAEAYDPHELHPYFSVVITSSDVSMPKPDRAMFDLALARSACSAAAAVHVGDNYYADIGGARAAGIAPVLLDPKGIFPEADCVVIQTLPQLLDHL